jgi:hypothetical protein
MPLPPLLDVLLQMRNPLYKWQLWKSEVRYQRYCGKRHYEIAMDKLKRLREHPPEPHTIAGTTVVRCVSLPWGTPPRLEATWSLPKNRLLCTLEECRVNWRAE